MSKEIYLDESYSVKQRAEDLVSRMTIEEAASQLRYDSLPIERLGVHRYNWWNEGLHGVARAGTATVFPQAIALAAIFDDDYIKRIAEIISTEARAKYNSYADKDDRDIYKGLTYWSPNINIFRDPRWGRGHETYGEDPYLTSRLGVSFIKGLQGEGNHMKIAACAKHFAVHSGPEEGRHSFNAIATAKDMEESYLPAFESCVKEGKVEGVMGAYNRTNDEPCCGSKTLLKDILRDKWGFDGYVVSDCWAIADFHKHHMVTSTVTESVALALKNGCDLNCGNTYLYMLAALKEGLITEDDIRESARNVMATRIKLGMFDKECEYDKIPYSVNDCKEHQKESLNAAKKSMVMLKNNGLLPLKKENIKNIAVIGPNADSKIMLEGNYTGTASRYITILEGIHEIAGEDMTVRYAEGCHLFKDKVENLALENDRICEAVAVAQESDVIILVLGLDSSIEGEEGDAGNSYAAGDKNDLKLPGLQEELLREIVKVGKPVILALGAGSAMDLNFADENCDAIINLWYPGSFGGRAFTDIIFGNCSPSGKLPITFYRTLENMPEFTDYSMKNRTYRYIEERPLYPFGFGLTYSNTEIKSARLAGDIQRDGYITVTADISNIGDYHIEDVMQVYVKNLTSEYAVRNHSLAGFKRVEIKKGETKNIGIKLDKKAFEVIDEEGNHLFESGRYNIYVGTSDPSERSYELTGEKPISLEFSI